MDAAFTTKRFSLSPRTATFLLVAVLFCVIQPADCEATIGLAEWTIETPGKNLIAHADPLADDHDVYLRRATKPSEVVDDEVVLVSHIEWWTYYKGYVVGKAKKGCFVFDERTHHVQYLKDQVGLDGRINQLNLPKPLSKRLTPQDGWNMVWGPIMKRAYQTQLKELEEGRGAARDLSPAERESLKNNLKEMLEKLAK